MGATSTLRAAATARNLAGPLLRAAYPIDVWGAHHMPSHGPVLIVGDQPELLAGALIKSVAPRPMHVIATASMMQVLPDSVLRAAGDIANPTPGIDAAQRALSVLADGGAVAILGDLPSAGYLAAASGAPVGTVIVFGAAGRVLTDPPALRQRVEIRFGPVMSVDADGDPCAMTTIRATGERIRQQLTDAHAEAVARRGGLNEETKR